MSPRTYYSPLWLDTLLSAVVNVTAFRSRREGSILMFMLIILLSSVGIGLGGQLVMIGSQGLFARALPVPMGRSTRGRVAQVIGGLVLGFDVIGLVAVVLYFLSDSHKPAFLLFAFSGVCLVIALFIYLMNCPGAVHDF